MALFEQIPVIGMRHAGRRDERDSGKTLYLHGGLASCCPLGCCRSLRTTIGSP